MEGGGRRYSRWTRRVEAVVVVVVLVLGGERPAVVGHSLVKLIGHNRDDPRC